VDVLLVHLFAFRRRFRKNGIGIYIVNKYPYVIIALIFIAFLVVPAGAQERPQLVLSEDEDEPMSVTVNAVVLDVVVTDRRGNRVFDLHPEDLEIYEDGVRQNISSMRLLRTVQEGDSLKTEVTHLEGAPDPVVTERPPEVRLITLVFDRISLQGRKLAREAAHGYFRELKPNEFASVMVIDRTLRVILPFSNDKERLAAAVELATGGTSQQFAAISNELRDTLASSENQAAAASTGFSAAGRDTGGPSADAGSSMASAGMDEMVASILGQTVAAEDTIQGRATIESLMTIVRGQRQYPGRKAVVFFADSISLPVQVIERFRDLISAANRHNVSFYCIDTKGLDTTSQLSAVTGAVGQAAGMSRRQFGRSGAAVTRDDVMVSEAAENVLRMSTQNSMIELAESTGGVVVSGTNDLVPGLRRASADLQTHYEISYNPINQNYDGAFRKLELKIRRDGVSARTRSGYYAVPAGSLAENPFEIPLLQALAAQQLAQELPFRSSNLQFPAPGGTSDVIYYVEVPLKDIALEVDSTGRQYAGNVAVLIAIKDAQGRVISRHSQDFPISGAADQLEETKSRNFVFYRTVEMLPGRYTVETVVRDAVTGKSSARRSVLIIPRRDSAALGLGSVVLVKRLDPPIATDVSLVDSPLSYENRMVVPFISPALDADQWPSASFYFTAVVPPGPEPTVDIVVLREGEVLGHMGQRNLPSPDERGVIRYLASLPLDKLQEGQYDIRVIISQGDLATVGGMTFSIQ
jgi:VWFA-related protein